MDKMDRTRKLKIAFVAEVPNTITEAEVCESIADALFLEGILVREIQEHEQIFEEPLGDLMEEVSRNEGIPLQSIHDSFNDGRFHLFPGLLTLKEFMKGREDVNLDIYQLSNGWWAVDETCLGRDKEENNE